MFYAVESGDLFLDCELNDYAPRFPAWDSDPRNITTGCRWCPHPQSQRNADDVTNPYTKNCLQCNKLLSSVPIQWFLYFIHAYLRFWKRTIQYIAGHWFRRTTIVRTIDPQHVGRLDDNDRNNDDGGLWCSIPSSIRGSFHFCGCCFVWYLFF